MVFSKKDRILVVAAHPDDEVLAMGGMLAIAKLEKIPVAVQFLGEGVSARFEKSAINGPDYHLANEKRMKGARKALASLGIKDVQYEGNLCCRFDGLEILELVKCIENKIDKFSPTHVFTHNPVEVNIDHRITYKAVETALRPKAGLSVREVYSFEILCSGNWTFEESFKPNLYVDIASVWHQKIRAWRYYEGEERPFPFPRSEKGLEVLANFRGMQSGLELAEAFKLLRRIT
jgi:LmbE family N-acetylglucosaminyl deacetylase